MKANELMIGDWVQIVEPCKYAGAIGRIKTLIDHKDDENAYFKVFLQNNTIHIGIEDICSEDIRPIPLTSEILEKNGFKQIGKKFIWGEIDDDLIEIIPSINNSYRITVSVADIMISCSIWCSYVHQLQHALRLCVIEKEIEL